MLDERGFVSETNATNMFMIKNNKLHTPFATNCLPGITRKTIIEIAEQNNIVLKERDISISEMYNADVVFTTGTMGELTNVFEIDGRKVKSQLNNPIFNTLKAEYRQLTENTGTSIK